MQDDASYQEQRRTRRVQAKLEVRFRFLSEEEALELVGFEALEPRPGEALQAGHTENLSQGGMSLTGELIGADQHMAKGQKLWLELELPDGHPERKVLAMAVAAWSIEGTGPKRKFTAGLMFLGISQEDLDRIGDYVDAQGR